MNLYQIFRPLIFRIEAETAHNLALNFLKFCPKTASLFCLEKQYDNLENQVFDINFKNPIGLAAGFDKNAAIALTLEKFGFGFVECGTVTPLPQLGNEKPRIFRLKKDKAIINRLGFNNLGKEVFSQNIDQIHNKIKIPLAINIGKNKDSDSAILDYLTLIDKFYNQASYITINISSPNTKNLRDLQKNDQIDLFLSEISQKTAQMQQKTQKNTPILLKVAPDLTIEQQENITAAVLKHKIDGMIISNTTIDRDLNLKSPNKNQNGGLSGAPLLTKSNEILANFYKFSQGKIPLIGVGGISNADDAYEKIKCGASLVQIYSAFIYQGFGLVERIKKQLSKKLKADGFNNIKEAIGTKI